MFYALFKCYYSEFLYFPHCRSITIVSMALNNSQTSLLSWLRLCCSLYQYAVLAVHPPFLPPSPHHAHLLKTFWSFTALPRAAPGRRHLTCSGSPHQAQTDHHPLGIIQRSLCTVCSHPYLMLNSLGSSTFPRYWPRALYTGASQHMAPGVKYFN